METRQRKKVGGTVWSNSLSMIGRVLCLTFLLMLSQPVWAAAKKAPSTPLTKLDAATEKMLDGLDKNQTKQFASIRNSHGIIKAVQDVEKNFDRALSSCGKNNPDLAKPMRDRMAAWNKEIDPVMKEARARLKEMIALQDYTKPANARAYLRLVDEAVAYKARDIKIIPIKSKKECEKLVDTMDDNQKKLKKLLIDNLGLKKKLTP